MAADLIAVRLRSTALAGLPLLVLFTVPVMVNAPRSQLTTGVVFCLGCGGYLAMLGVDGRERIRLWGKLISLWRAGPRDVADLETLVVDTSGVEPSAYRVFVDAKSGAVLARENLVDNDGATGAASAPKARTAQAGERPGCEVL